MFSPLIHTAPGAGKLRLSRLSSVSTGATSQDMAALGRNRKQEATEGHWEEERPTGAVKPE